MDSIDDACKFGSDAWHELQAFKTRQLNRREKLNRHKNLNQDLISGITTNNNNNQQTLNSGSTSSNPSSFPSISPTSIQRNSITSTISNTSTDQSISITNNINNQSSSSSTTTSSLKTLINSKVGDDVESLLSLSSTRERENKKLGEELLELLSKPTAKERNLLEKFRSADGYRVQEFCPKGTKFECKRNNQDGRVCDKLHFKKIIAKHTDESLGDCSFLNTCFNTDSCKYVHYEIDYDDKQPTNGAACNSGSSLINESDLSAFVFSPGVKEQAKIDAKNRKRFKTVLHPPQWIQCDIRYFDMSLLGKFSVVMADAPWCIHQILPYGTLSDDEMRGLNLKVLQDEGFIFLWVTGRAMELGRECLALWGYERCDEIVWVKTNQLQRIIRTGRTGHYLNHSKEHCLVGVKGNPKSINRGIDCDVIVAEVRATSHKPDEIYGIIERLSPGTRKIELFGRPHNVQPNWLTLGNQLNGVSLVEPSLVNAFKKLNLPFQTSTMTDSSVT